MVSLGQVIALIKAMGGSGGSSLPSVSSTDNGDVLTVVNGAWDKAASTGLPAVTSADNGKGLSVQNGAWATEPYPRWDVVIRSNSPFVDTETTFVYLKGSWQTFVTNLFSSTPAPLAVALVIPGEANDDYLEAQVFPLYCRICDYDMVTAGSADMQMYHSGGYLLITASGIVYGDD